MSKAVLVMDMPKSCDECDFVDEQYHYCNIPWFGKDVSDYVACRHENCPLKPMPEKRDTKYNPTRNPYITEGYNACIDELLGEENG